MKKLFSEIPHIKGDRVILREVRQEDASALQELRESPAVSRYLPTFLFESKYEDISYVISHLYDECLNESLILGVYIDDTFCGLIELYGYRAEIHKISIGCRLLERYWGKGIASEAVEQLVNYLYCETDIEIITASTMIENKGSARALARIGFDLVAHAVPEDWGYETPVTVDKWIR